MSDRFRSFVDLHVIVRDEAGRVLLGRRQNTGWGDGQWGLPSGHLESGESAGTGAAREAREELGITIDPADLVLVHLLHHRTDSGRVALFFEAAGWGGEVVNAEPHKCREWRWFDTGELPGQTVPYIRHSLVHCLTGSAYSERGWK